MSRVFPKGFSSLFPPFFLFRLVVVVAVVVVVVVVVVPVPVALAVAVAVVVVAVVAVAVVVVVVVVIGSGSGSGSGNSSSSSINRASWVRKNVGSEKFLVITWPSVVREVPLTVLRIFYERDILNFLEFLTLATFRTARIEIRG